MSEAVFWAPLLMLCTLALCALVSWAGMFVLNRDIAMRPALRWGLALLGLGLGLGLALLMARDGRGWQGLTLGAFGCALVDIGCHDAARRIVPNVALLALLPLAVAHLLLMGWPVMLASLIAAACVVAVMLPLSLLSKGALGMGDVKLMAVMALFLGPTGMMSALLIGSLAACAYAVALLIRYRDRKRSFAFAPFLALGALVAMWL